VAGPATSRDISFGGRRPSPGRAQVFSDAQASMGRLGELGELGEIWVIWVSWVSWVSWVEGLQNRSTRLVHAETGQQWSLSSMWAPSPAWKSQHDVGDTKSEWPSPEVHSV
jgi:hypothetical protein